MTSWQRRGRLIAGAVALGVAVSAYWLTSGRRTPPPVQRKTYTPPRKPPSASKPDNKKYMIIAASAVALMLAVFILPRCGKQPEPVKGKPVQKQK